MRKKPQLPGIRKRKPRRVIDDEEDTPFPEREPIDGCGDEKKAEISAAPEGD